MVKYILEEAIHKAPHLFGFFIQAHASNIEGNLPAQSSTCPAKEAFETILADSTHNCISHIVKYASLQPLLQNLTWNTCCCSQDCAAEGCQRLHLWRYPLQVSHLINPYKLYTTTSIWFLFIGKSVTDAPANKHILYTFSI